MDSQSHGQQPYSLTYDPLAHMQLLSLNEQVRERVGRAVEERLKWAGMHHARDALGGNYFQTSINEIVAEGYQVFHHRQFNERILHVSKIQTQGCRCQGGRAERGGPCNAETFPQDALAKIFRSLSHVVAYDGGTMPLIPKKVWERLAEIFPERSMAGNVNCPTNPFGGTELIQANHDLAWHMDVCSFVRLYELNGWEAALSQVRAGRGG